MNASKKATVPGKQATGRRSTGRLAPPEVSFPLVRTRLLSELTKSSAPTKKLLTIIAPTGFGKTSVKAALFEHYSCNGTACIWLTLDERYETIERVLALLEDALEVQDAEGPHLQSLIGGSLPVEYRMEALLTEVSKLTQPTAIFLDNLGYCVDEAIGKLLDQFVFLTPPNVHFVCSSQQAVQFSQARAKLQGRLQEIKYSDLAFQPEEIREMFGEDLCRRLGNAGVDAVMRQTEGWPAAVRLLQIVLSASDNPAQSLNRFSGADEDLVQLLRLQVLAEFSPDQCRFLLEIAHLRTFCIELCRYATGDVQAAQHVETFVERNIFVIPLDRERRWFRMHGLLREFLLDEGIRRIDPLRRREFLERAAEWSEGTGRWRDAMEYALASGSSNAAAATLDRIAPIFVRDRGDLQQFLEWVEHLRTVQAEVGLEADLWYVWALVFFRRYSKAQVHHARIAARIARAGNGSTPEIVSHERRLKIIAMAIHVYTDRLAEAYRDAKDWLPNADGDDPFDVATVFCAAGIHLASAFEFVEARSVMRNAQSIVVQADSPYGQAWVSLLTEMIPLYEGDYATVYRNLLGAQAKVKEALGDSSDIADTIALVCAKCAVEMGLDEEAKALLAQGLRRASTHGLVDTVVCGLDAAVKLWTASPDDPVSIAHLWEIASGYPPRASLMLSCYVIRRLLRLGRNEEALLEAAKIGLTPALAEQPLAERLPKELSSGRGKEEFIATEIELLIATGHLKAAEALIAEEARDARKQGRWARLAELALCEAAVSVCSLNAQKASRHLVRAIGFATNRRILRPFRDRGPMVAGLVNDTKPQAWGLSVDAERKFFVEICRGLPLTNSSVLLQMEQLQIEAQLLDTPTARELELLGLVEAGLSNQQLADRLGLSLSTVKWHLFNLYAKLGVTSRSAALARARVLNLLSR